MTGRVTTARVAAATLLLGAICGCDKYDSSLLGEVSAHEPPGSIEPVCGDGRVDEAERCDIAILDGMEGACPTTCPGDDPCYLQVVAGYDCQALCVGVAITRAFNEDDCCPPGVGPGEDSDCGGCGDGIIGPKETCDPPESCPVLADCPRGNSCFFKVFIGDPDACTSDCQIALTSSCEDDNNCCPADCTSASDNDCSASCGNQIVEPAAGETCEVGDPTFPCRPSCDDGFACTQDLRAGSAENCNVECSNDEITVPINDDGCCPPEAHANIDNDCLPVCGNLVREGDETCDPCDMPCDDGDVCTIDTPSGNPATCSAVCDHTAAEASAVGDGCCPPGANANNDSDCSPVCGNDIQEGGEECDGGGLCRNCILLFHSSLVHRYSFNGSGSTITDSVGTSDGTCKNCTVANGAVDLAEGKSGDYVELPAGLIHNLTEVTFEVWVDWESSDIRQHIIDFGDNVSGQGTSFFMLEGKSGDGYLAAYVNFTPASADATNDWAVVDNAALSASGVQHLAVTFNGTRLQLFLNGALQATTTKAAQSLSAIADTHNWLGRSQFSANPELDGKLYEFRIYSKALSATEVQASYAADQNP